MVESKDVINGIVIAALVIVIFKFILYLMHPCNVENMESGDMLFTMVLNPIDNPEKTYKIGCLMQSTNVLNKPLNSTINDLVASNESVKIMANSETLQTYDKNEEAVIKQATGPKLFADSALTNGLIYTRVIAKFTSDITNSIKKPIVIISFKNTTHNTSDVNDVTIYAFVQVVEAVNTLPPPLPPSTKSSNIISSTDDKTVTVKTCTNQTLPVRRTTFLGDCGYPDKTRGWFDLDNTGYADDFCRFVGDKTDAWWTCTKATDNDLYIAPRGTYTFSEKDPYMPYNGEIASCPLMAPIPDPITSSDPAPPSSLPSPIPPPTSVPEPPPVTVSKNWAGKEYTTNGMCGPNYGDKACDNGQCCSSSGWCGGAAGQNDAWCGTTMYEGKYNSVQPRRTTISGDCGYPDMPRGWYDLDNTGYANAFCRYVGDKTDAWWTCTKPSDPANYISPRGTHTYDAARLVPYKGEIAQCPV